MSHLKNPVNIKSDRIRLPITFDVEKMQKEVLILNLKPFVYYDVLQLRGPAHIINPSLPPPPPAEDYADGSWTDWLDTSILKKSPYLSEIIDYFRQMTRVTLVRLLRLEPGSVVKEHTDPTLGMQIRKSVIRLTIPIFSNDKVQFILNGQPVPMKLGECWYLRLTDPHSVINDGNTERINLTIDMVPNEKIRSLILEGQ